MFIVYLKLFIPKTKFNNHYLYINFSKTFQNNLTINNENYQLNFLIISIMILQLVQDIDIKGFSQDGIFGENVSFGADRKYLIQRKMF